nr:MAG TPA: major capsid protein [Caudoviricetes sp.]
MKYDFSGYATKNNVTCSDGRTILENAFIENDGQDVPLVWQHGHTDPENVLGHAKLENRKDGVYAYCELNNSDAGNHARELVRHGDINALSIYANRLSQKGRDVIHGNIVEVSLVLSGANPGALIDNVALEHSDGSVEDDLSEAIIYTDAELEHASKEQGSSDASDEDDETDADDETLAEVLDSMSEKQKTAMYAVISQLVDADDEGETEDEQSEAEHSDDTNDKENTLAHTNVFEGTVSDTESNTLSHSQIEAIFADARRPGMTLASSFMAHAKDYGIKDPSVLFPDAVKVDREPQRITHQNEWVTTVLNGCKHSPFSRVKTQWSDLTLDTLRAKGYITATKKEDVVYEIATRVTTPTTVYSRSKMDRDDIIDITDFSVVDWIKRNLREALDEELARAILVGDGRQASDPHKVKTDNIRPIWTDNDLFSHKVKVGYQDDPTNQAYAFIDATRRSRKFFRGSGTPTLFTTNSVVCFILEMKDTQKHYIYETKEALARVLNVAQIVEVEQMEGLQSDVAGGKKADLWGIITNLSDYTIGADKGGEVTYFENFDIDFNQHKYLYETRASGALTKFKSALVLERQPKA